MRTNLALSRFTLFCLSIFLMAPSPPSATVAPHAVSWTLYQDRSDFLEAPTLVEDQLLQNLHERGSPLGAPRENVNHVWYQGTFDTPSLPNGQIMPRVFDNFLGAVRDSFSKALQSPSPQLQIYFNSHGSYGALAQENCASLQHMDLIRGLLSTLRGMNTQRKPVRLRIVYNACRGASFENELNRQLKFYSENEFNVHLYYTKDRQDLSYGGDILRILKSAQGHINELRKSGTPLCEKCDPEKELSLYLRMISQFDNDRHFIDDYKVITYTNQANEFYRRPNTEDWMRALFLGVFRANDPSAQNRNFIQILDEINLRAERSKKPAYDLILNYFNKSSAAFQEKAAIISILESETPQDYVRYYYSSGADQSFGTTEYILSLVNDPKKLLKVFKTFQRDRSVAKIAADRFAELKVYDPEWIEAFLSSPDQFYYWEDDIPMPAAQEDVKKFVLSKIEEIKAISDTDFKALPIEKSYEYEKRVNQLIDIIRKLVPHPELVRALEDSTIQSRFPYVSKKLEDLQTQVCVINGFKD